MDAKLPRTSPEAQGIHSQDILKLVGALDGIGNEVHGLMIARNDCVVAESWLKPYAPHIPHACHSLGKSYTCTAVGVACTEGRMTPDDLLCDIFFEEICRMGLTLQPGMEKVRIRDLMTMSSGTEGMPTFNEHYLANFLTSPMAYVPGTKFYYNTTGSCVLGAAVEKVTGMPLMDYLRPRLFQPMGIGEEDLVWQRFADGRYAEPGICATTEANLRLGLLYLHEGKLFGKQLVDASWIRQATACQIATSDHPGQDDGSMGYGWQLWMGRVPGLYRFDGGQGQLCFVYPKKNCVIALHQAGRDPYDVARSIELVHAFMQDLSDAPLTKDDVAADALNAYLLQRSLPSPDVRLIPPDASDWCGVYGVMAGEVNPWFEVVPDKEDFWHYFYDPGMSARVTTMELRLRAPYLEITFNRHSTIRARLDGVYEVCSTVSPLPGLTHTCAVAAFTDQGGWRIDLRWLNGWSRAILQIMPGERSGEIHVSIEKDMLHDRLAPIRYEAEARLIAL